jgi:hypothetical protein
MNLSQTNLMYLTLDRNVLVSSATRVLQWSNRIAENTRVTGIKETMLKQEAPLFKTPPYIVTGRVTNFCSIQISSGITKLCKVPFVSISMIHNMIWEPLFRHNTKRKYTVLIRWYGAGRYCWNRCKVVLENFKGLVKQQLTNSNTRIVVHSSSPHLLNPQPLLSD